MARQFARASSQYLSSSAQVVSAAPFTFCAWFWTSDLTTEQGIIAFGRVDPNGYSELTFRGAEGGDPVAFFNHWGTALSFPQVGSAVSASTWHFVAGRCNSATDFKLWVDTSTATSTTNPGAFPTFNQYWFGRSRRNMANYLSGAVAEVAAWDVGLTDAEVALLSKGYSALFVRPASLVSYLPLVRNEDSDKINTANNMTANNSPTVAAHPRIIYPAAPLWVPAASAAPPAGTLLRHPGMTGGMKELAGGMRG